MKHKLILITILILAFVLRFMPYFTQAYPIGGNTDTAHHFMLIDTIITDGYASTVPNHYFGPTFWPQDKEIIYPMGFHYTIALISKTFNLTPFKVLAIVPTIFGVISVLGMFLLAKELSGNVRVGLFASFLLCVSGYQARLIFAGNFPNITSMSLIPLVMWCIIKATNSYRYRKLLFLFFGATLCALTMVIYGPVTLSVAFPFLLTLMFFLWRSRLSMDRFGRDLAVLLTVYGLAAILTISWVVKATYYQLFQYVASFGSIGSSVNEILWCYGIDNVMREMFILGWLGVATILFEVLVGQYEAIKRVGSRVQLFFTQIQLSHFATFALIWFLSTVTFTVLAYTFRLYVYHRIQSYFSMPFCFMSAYTVERVYASFAKKKPNVRKIVLPFVLFFVLANPLLNTFVYVSGQSSVLDDTKHSTFMWIRGNTPKDAVFIVYGWWSGDFGYGRALLCWAPAISHRAFIWMGKPNSTFQEILETHTYYGKRATHLLVDVNDCDVAFVASNITLLHAHNYLIIYKIE